MESYDGDYRYLAETESRRIALAMEVRLSHDRPIDFLNETVAAWLREHAERPDIPYRILVDTISCNPGSLRTIIVTETGEHKGAAGTRGPRAGQPPARTGPGEQPGPPPGPAGRQPSGPQKGLGGGGTPGKRKRPTERRRAPGTGLGGMGAGDSSGPTGRDMGRGGGDFESHRPGSGGDRRGGGRPQSKSVDALAPVPDGPSLYPPNSRYYRVLVTFEVELLPDTPPPSEPDVARVGEAGEEPS